MMKNVKIAKMAAEINATPDEVDFIAQSVMAGYHSIVGRCHSLDQQIQQLTAQRVALQPELEAAQSLAAKVVLISPLPVEGEQ